jgi:hypothetical protein
MKQGKGTKLWQKKETSQQRAKQITKRNKPQRRRMQVQTKRTGASIRMVSTTFEASLYWVLEDETAK